MQMGRGKAPRCVFRLFREVIALPEGKSADLVTPRKARGLTRMATDVWDHSEPVIQTRLVANRVG